MPDKKPEFYLSVDIETAGPNPANYALLAIGACTVNEPRRNFYLEVKPLTLEILPEAYAIHGLDPRVLAHTGVPVNEAMQRFAGWIHKVTPAGFTPVFVGFNAPFDWMFINDYFHRFLGENPFGHSAVDIKALYMGVYGVAWSETSFNEISRRYNGDECLVHNALQDAIEQAELFQRILEDSRRISTPRTR